MWAWVNYMRRNGGQHGLGEHHLRAPSHSLAWGGGMRVQPPHMMRRRMHNARSAAQSWRLRAGRLSQRSLDQHALHLSLSIHTASLGESAQPHARRACCGGTCRTARGLRPPPARACCRPPAAQQSALRGDTLEMWEMCSRNEHQLWGDRTSTRLPAGVHKLRGNKYSNAVAVLQQHRQRLEVAAADAADTVASKQQHEQVLIDFLIHLEEHCSLQRLAAPGEGPPGGAAPEQLGSCSYAAQLVRCVTPAQLQVARSRTTADWIAFSHAMFQRLAGLVELLDREDAAQQQQQAQQEQQQQEQQQMPDLLSAQLHQAVDYYVTQVLLAFAGLPENAPATAGTTMLNLVTLQPEAPSPQHWRRVVQRMQLSPWQLGALASGFRVFSRLKQQNRAQALQLAALVDSCSSLQVQALAAQSGSSDRQGPTASTAGSDSSSRAATPGAAAAAQQPPEVLAGTTDDPAQLWRRHPELMQLAPATLNMFVVSSVTRLQIAHMVVASFPFVPRPAPIAEAAAWLWEEQPRGVVSTLPVPPEVQEHAAQRSVLLAAQQAWWWEQQAAGG